jgi:3-hydroxyanthranilic acid dioxygenase
LKEKSNDMIRRPFNLKQWITDNRDLLKPPVGNKNLYADAGDYIVMIVGGPNARKDYHFNETEELFYQWEAGGYSDQRRGNVFVASQYAPPAGAACRFGWVGDRMQAATTRNPRWPDLVLRLVQQQTARVPVSFR